MLSNRHPSSHLIDQFFDDDEYFFQAPSTTMVSKKRSIRNNDSNRPFKKANRRGYQIEQNENTFALSVDLPGVDLADISTSVEEAADSSRGYGSKDLLLKIKAVRDKFKLDLIRNEEDLHEYKNLLNAMAALFYTNHKMASVKEIMAEWHSLML